MAGPSAAIDEVDDRTPVLVGVGTAQRHGVADELTGGPADGAAEGAADGAAEGDAARPDRPTEPVDLMIDAALAALRDACPAGDTAVLRDAIGLVAVPEGNWTYPDPARLVAVALGLATPPSTRDGARSPGTGAVRTVRVEIGVPQCTPIRIAAERIHAGELDAALVVGGEAKATQQRIVRAGGTPVETDQGDTEPDERWAPVGELMAEPEISAGIWDPVAQYACIENALRHAEGTSPDDHLDAIAELWAAFNAVAASNPLAAFPAPLTRQFLRVAGEGNRPLAFPYAKWHSTQWSVDQGGALVLCSAATARAAGVPRDRWVFPRVLVESSGSVSLSRRDEVHRWPAMRVLGEAAARHLGRPLADVEHTELYSCFPAAVRVQQRELDLPLDGVPTLTGGMAFAGGPFNNFTYQATATVVAGLRADPGSFGLVSTVSGLLTKPGLAVWSTDPGDSEPLLADLADDASAATPVRDVTGEFDGPARVVTYTVTYEGASPSSAFVIAELRDGRRWVGTSTDPELLARGVAGPELIDSAVLIAGRTCRLG